MTATDILELNLQYECPDISSPVVIDYIREVEHRLQMEVLDMKETLESMEAKVAEKLRENLGEMMERNILTILRVLS